MDRTIDLVPREYATGRRVHRRTFVWVLIGSLALLAVLGAHLVMAARLKTLESGVAPLRERVVSLRDREYQVGPLVEELRAARAKHRLATRLRDEPFWPGVLSDLSRAAGDELSLQDLTIERKENDEGLSYVLRASGVAPSNQQLIRFMTQLSQSNHVANLDLGVSRLSEVAEAAACVEFELEGVLK